VPLLNFVFRTSKTIPIASAKDNPELLQRAYDEIANALRNGDLVGIFPKAALPTTASSIHSAPASHVSSGARRSGRRAGVARSVGKFFQPQGWACNAASDADRAFSKIGLAVREPVPPER
jgi:1-acyl-sn-glycerol-3-phosphate acyltransferase